MPLSCKRQKAPIGAASGTELVPNIVDFGSTNCCQASFTHMTSQGNPKVLDVLEILEKHGKVISKFSYMSIQSFFLH